LFYGKRLAFGNLKGDDFSSDMRYLMSLYQMPVLLASDARNPLYRLVVIVQNLMKLISAVVRPKYLPRLTTALRRANVSGVTVVKAQGFGREQLDSDVELVGFLTERIKLEVAVEDDEAQRIVKIINDNAGTGRDGDGIIFVWDLVFAKRIERGGTDPGV
jgi:nitrogen regulatory protein PII